MPIPEGMAWIDGILAIVEESANRRLMAFLDDELLRDTLKGG